MDERVADRVAEPVVDALQAVDLEDHHGRVTVLLELCREPALEAGAAGKAGQGIVIGQPAETLLAVLAIGDVAQRRIEFEAALVTPDRKAEVHRHLGPVLADRSTLEQLAGELEGVPPATRAIPVRWAATKRCGR